MSNTHKLKINQSSPPFIIHYTYIIHLTNSQHFLQLILAAFTLLSCLPKYVFNTLLYHFLPSTQHYKKLLKGAEANLYTFR